MDFGNSGSLQSSSGGGDEFDSRCGGDSSPLSALLRQPPPPPNVEAFGGSFYGLQDLATPPLSHWSSTPLPAGARASPSPPSCHGVAASASQTAEPAALHAVAAPPRRSRKRTRASRRAPTTVLTTDTSNFRAMVQEFTGTPSAPFAGASARSRFDHLFPSRSAAAARPATLPPYLLRPFAQKLHAPAYPPPYVTPSTSSPAPANIFISASTGPSTTAVESSDSYQLASSPFALLGMQNHSSNSYLSFRNPLIGGVGAQLDGDAKYPAHPLFDRGLAPSAARLQDPADFLGLTHGIMSSDGTHLHPRNGDRGHGDDELSGLVGGASVIGTGGCKATYSSGASSVSRASPPLERNAQSAIGGSATTTTPVAATAAMRTQGADLWVCTSE